MFSCSIFVVGYTAEARKLMSEEHKALGRRPPPGSLAAQAQAAAAKHPKSNGHSPTHDLQRAALEDAAKIEGVSATVAGIDLNYIGEGGLHLFHNL